MKKRKASSEEAAVCSSSAEDVLRAVYNDAVMKHIVARVMNKVVLSSDLQGVDYQALDAVADENINMICRNGDALIHAAVRFDDQELFSYLIARDDVAINLQNANGDTALMIAVKEDDQTSISSILEWMEYFNKPIDLATTNLQGESLSGLISNNPDSDIINGWIFSHNVYLDFLSVIQSFNVTENIMPTPNVIPFENGELEGSVEHLGG